MFSSETLRLRRRQTPQRPLRLAGFDFRRTVPGLVFRNRHDERIRVQKNRNLGELSSNKADGRGNAASKALDLCVATGNISHWWNGSEYCAHALHPPGFLYGRLKAHVHPEERILAFG